MDVLPYLPLVFLLMVTAMTILWHKWNGRTFRQSSDLLRLAQVDLVGTHTLALFGLFFLAISGLAWESPKIQNSGLFWVAVGLAVFCLAAVMKIRVVKALPDNLWHFTERNRQLVAEGKIVRFHLENDVAALLPLLILVWLAHRFG